jgi:hypothetical protein
VVDEESAFLKTKLYWDRRLFLLIHRNKAFPSGEGGAAKPRRMRRVYF